MRYLVSALWGVVAGVTATMVAIGLLIAASWAVLFGDHPWPSWWMPVIGTAAVLTGVAVGGAAGRGVWVSLRRAWSVSPGAARTRQWVLLLGGLAAMALLVVWLAHER